MSQDNVYKASWTDLADSSYEEELKYIHKKWNQDEVIKFMILVDEFINKLESGVIAGKVSKKTEIRSFVISKQTTLFFDINEETETIELLLFWNNTKDPKTLKRLLKNI